MAWAAMCSLAPGCKMAKVNEANSEKETGREDP